jgi:uncharacterized protein with NAD-binding domain and iron-sulfur cluster
MAAKAEPKRVAILGSGMAALTTALELTNEPDWRERYDITVYQLGWRLGGKGASGRRRERGARIEEHGLHVWFGCYHNAFRLLDQCYRELARPADAPLATVDKAFEPKNETPYVERVADGWSVWPLWFPPNDAKPWEGGAHPSLWDYITMMARFVAHSVTEWLHETKAAKPEVHKAPPWVAQHIAAAGQEPLAEGKDHAAKAAEPPARHSTFAHLLERLVQSLHPDPHKHAAAHHHGIIWLADRFKAWLFKRLEGELERHDALRRFMISMDLALTSIRGLLADGVIFHGLESLDGEDMRAWLARHGATPLTLHSVPLRALYDLYFAYEDGDVERPNLSAAAGLSAVLHLTMGYKGAVVWEMMAGMGEAVIAPIYQVLERRGVRFRFFRRVTALELSGDKHTVARIRIARQVNLKSDAYQPLIDVKGLPCWPSEPLYDQIEHGEDLRGVDLESWWSGWQDVGEEVLEAGCDFDLVVLGISLAGLESVCGELIDASRRWRDLIANVRTNQTQAMQLWLNCGLEDLGWTRGPVPVDAAPEPMDVWADRSDILPLEAWPKRGGPRSLQYHCGPMKGDYAARPPSDNRVPQEAKDEVKRIAVEWLRTQVRALWPKARAEDTGFDWTLLYDPEGRTGEERFEAQYWRGNVSPSERYVLSLPGTAQYRLKAGDTDFANLVVTGDWTWSDWNIGCIEAAVHTGINAARACDEARRRSG